MSDRGLYPLEDLKRDLVECPVGFRCQSCKSVGSSVGKVGTGQQRTWHMRCHCGATWSFSEQWRDLELGKVRAEAEFHESIMKPIRDRAAGGE